jgi:hypothetical protein
VIRIFVGYDPREPAAYHVLCHSILARASAPVSIAPLALAALGGLLHRPRHPLQSTDFSFSRFLVPHLCDHEGWALFLDCDMLFLRDVAELWAMRDPSLAVQVVRHDHAPREASKFLGAAQTRYPMKNWSSLMLFNNRRCDRLTAALVDEAPGLDLHQFRWLRGAHEIGGLPPEWNHLVDHDPPRPAGEIANLHYTNGGPYFPEYARCGYADLWFAERDRMLSCAHTPAALAKAV